MIEIGILIWGGFGQEYRRKLADVREEILRKRRAGKLPAITTSLLKHWWDAHSKWPYPTVLSRDIAVYYTCPSDRR